MITVAHLFKTKEDIYRHLLSGGRIRHHTWKDGYIHFKDGDLVNSAGTPAEPYFGVPADWVVVREPFVILYEAHLMSYDSDRAFDRPPRCRVSFAMVHANGARLGTTSDTLSLNTSVDFPRPDETQRYSVTIEELAHRVK